MRQISPLDDEKLVIFTEHKDTLDYLEGRLVNNGYKVATIHGGKSVEERRSAQSDFAKEAKILIATDAAGEGINLQFCWVMANYDVPWNPARLEQRNGRIDRKLQPQPVVYCRNIFKYYVSYKLTQEARSSAQTAKEQVAPAKR